MFFMKMALRFDLIMSGIGFDLVFNFPIAFFKELEPFPPLVTDFLI
jgi:hypothetical protein